MESEKVKEIKKALECCLNPKLTCCNDCPYNNNGRLSCLESEMLKDALNLINEHENEIERLRQEVRDTDKMARNSIEQYKNDYDKAFERLKAQQREIDRLKIQLEQANARIVNCSGSELDETNAVKEFAEKLKEKALSHCRITNCYELKFIETTIDDLLYDWQGHPPVCKCELKIDELLKEY